jgi:hypothetical protein
MERKEKKCSPVPALQSLTAQQILLKEFKNLSLSEPTGSPKDQREEVVIEILDQPRETEDFGATVNMSAEDLLKSEKWWLGCPGNFG